MELFDVCDCYGKWTGRTRQKGEEFAEGEYHRAVEVWILNSKKELLLQRRSTQCELLPGIWAMTTGRVIAGETTKEACVRELGEELGIEVEEKRMQLLCSMIHGELIWEVFLLRIDCNLEELKLEEAEVSAVRWADREELATLVEKGEFFEYPELWKVHEMVLQIQTPHVLP